MTSQIPRKLFLHWSAGNWTTAYPHYHTSVTYECNWLTLWKRKAVLRLKTPYTTYLSHHTSGRNTNAVGLAVAGAGYGYPVMPVQVEMLCKEAARVAIEYDIPIDKEHCMTHAEAAILDKYYPERTDFDKRGDELRAKMVWYKDNLLKRGYKKGDGPWKL